MTQLPNQNFEHYTRKGCVGCCLCEKGSKNVGRTAALWTIGFCTLGTGLIVLSFFKKCVYCGHSTFMNGHTAHAQ